MKTALLLLLSALSCCAVAQHDRVLPMGRNYVLITFSDSGRTAKSFINKFSSSRTSASICDKTGDFQFVTTGSKIFNRLGQVMSNGDNMLDPLLTTDWTDFAPMFQGAICLPRTDSTYYILYQSENDSSYSSGFGQPNLLHYAIVDMRRQNGLGEVVAKRQNVYHGYIGEGRLTACRHANGRDWWLLQPGFNNNRYHTFLISPDTILYVGTQTIGLGYIQPDSESQAVFSPDGTKYVTTTSTSRVNIMDFDRCSGLLSNYSNVVLPNRKVNNQTNGKGAFGCSFSSNGRYLYVNTLQSVYQIDVADSNRLHHIADWDSSYQWWYYPFANSYLMPDNSIFIASFGGGSTAFHEVKNPNSPADSVIFLHDEFYIFEIVTARPLPNIPHYRLGKATGSLCDTIVSGIDEVQNKNTVKIYPNPANSMVNVSLTEFNPDVMLTLLDITGKKIHHQSMYLETTIDISNYASGMYFVRVESKGKLMGVRKLMKE